jgi:hypothetical protein
MRSADGGSIEQSERKDKIDALDPAEHRILITVNLQDNIGPPDVREWKNWLTANIPSRVLSATITIEAVFRGSSSLLPVALQEIRRLV